MSDDNRGPSYYVYGDLCRKLVGALRRGDIAQRERIWSAIELFREIYPESVAQWEADYPVSE